MSQWGILLENDNEYITSARKPRQDSQSQTGCLSSGEWVSDTPQSQLGTCLGQKIPQPPGDLSGITYSVHESIHWSEQSRSAQLQCRSLGLIRDCWVRYYRGDMAYIHIFLSSKLELHRHTSCHFCRKLNTEENELHLLAFMLVWASFPP